MREKFTLICRTTGFLIFCYSIMTILTTLSMLIMPPDMNKLVSMPSSYMGSSDIMNQLLMYSKNTAEYMWVYCLTTIALSGLIPLCFGLYLMVSGHFFIDLCYPVSSAPEETIEPSVSFQSTDRHNDVENDRRFMPPELR